MKIGNPVVQYSKSDYFTIITCIGILEDTGYCYTRHSHQMIRMQSHLFVCLNIGDFWQRNIDWIMNINNIEFYSKLVVVWPHLFILFCLSFVKQWDPVSAFHILSNFGWWNLQCNLNFQMKLWNFTWNISLQLGRLQ